MLRSFIQMTAIILTLGASCFLLKSNLGLTPEVIAKLSSTDWEFNKTIVRGFSEQAADTRVGFILLIAAFILQLINALWPIRYKDFSIDWYGILISLGVSIILLTFSHWYSKALAEDYNMKTMKILKEEEQNSGQANS